ncbi:MAG: hypothetical protein JSR93_00655 [Verrucomicrobia bacterium]|jgi:hypothetical protein|nr:hypothetical protein [Verrucomicrobiota bacterium]
MNKKEFSFRIASDVNKEKVFVEVFYGDDQWAEISQEEKDPLVIFFSPSNAKYWEFSFQEALEILLKAKECLLKG